MPFDNLAGAVRELVPLLFVDDINRSVEFYRDRLGFTVTQRWEPDGALAWCRLQRDGSALMLQQATDEDAPASERGRGVGFFFVCDNADTMYAEFVARGLEVAPPQAAFYGMNQLFLRDPDRYDLCFESVAG
jgi:uncharacterized glyoxalase superfamily protein PhnB